MWFIFFFSFSLQLFHFSSTLNWRKESLKLGYYDVMLGDWLIPSELVCSGRRREVGRKHSFILSKLNIGHSVMTNLFSCNDKHYHYRNAISWKSYFGEWRFFNFKNFDSKIKRSAKKISDICKVLKRND